MPKFVERPGLGGRPLASRVLQGLDRWAAHPGVAMMVVAGDLIWVVYSVAVGFPARLETVFQTLVAALTLMMVFVIQHSQAKVSAATQRKLDEIVRALPDADEALIGLERGPDGDVQAAARAHLLARSTALSSARHEPAAGSPVSGGGVATSGRPLRAASPAVDLDRFPSMRVSLALLWQFAAESGMRRPSSAPTASPRQLPAVGALLRAVTRSACGGSGHTADHPGAEVQGGMRRIVDAGGSPSQG